MPGIWINALPNEMFAKLKAIYVYTPTIRLADNEVGVTVCQCEHSADYIIPLLYEHHPHDNFYVHNNHKCWKRYPLTLFGGSIEDVIKLWCEPQRVWRYKRTHNIGFTKK